MGVDFTSELGKKTAARIAAEQVVWLTTAGKSGTPQPNPVWFIWNGSQFLVISEPHQAKLANIAGNSRVALNFNSTFHGGDVAVLTGSAVHDPSGFTPEEETVYREKYLEGMASIGLTPEGMYAKYSQLIRIAPDSLRGF